MVNVDNLKVSEHERVSEEELVKRLDVIKDEISQIGGVDESDDQIEIAEGSLNGQFAEFLLRPENKEILNRLKSDVDKLKGDWERLGSKAGKKLTNLADFLDDITNEKRMEKDYEEFMKKIVTPKKLNTMKSWEIRRLNLYLGMREDKALEAYKAMKSINGKFDENKMKDEDMAFFESVWNTIEKNYKNSDTFIIEDYSALASLQPTVASLKTLAGENWDGKNESINIPDVENSIIDKSKVKEKVDGINNQRIESNRDKVKNITITVDELSKFTKKDGVLKYEGAEFTVDKMMELFGDKIKTEAGRGTEFVNESERDSMVDECKDDIFNNLKTQLLDDDRITVEQEHDADEGDESSEGNETHVERTYEESKDNFKIKMPALKDKIKERGFIDGNEDGDKIKFNIEKVKGYLEGLKDRSWGELERPADPVDRGLWTIAVQIALNFIANRDNKPEYNVVYIDGIRGEKTKKGVTEFQRQNDLKFGRNQQPDGLPGKVTIAKILDVIGEGGNTSIGNAVEEGTPAVEEGTPAVEEETPTVEEETPTVEEETPAVEEETPAAE